MTICGSIFMNKIKLNDFYNDGFGWVCRHCERELKQADSGENENRSRLMREGEAESKAPVFSNRAMAKWLDASQRVLICPRCGITESAEPF